MKEEHLHIKVTAKEKKILIQNAEKAGMTISQFIRTQCIYKKIK